VELAPGENWKGKLKLRVTPFVPPH
jgi:hypothetical protein